MNFWTRRQFMQLSTAAAFQLMTGCSPKDMIMDGKPPHHLTTGFRNYPIAPKPQTPGLSFLLRRIKELNGKPEIPRDHVIETSLALTALKQYSTDSAITWIGHSTYLLRLENRHFLLDPFFSNLASPLPFGPERFVPPGIALEQLPPIDGVVISHNHYDHLDAKTIEAFKGKERIAVFVPLGLKPFFTKRGYENVRELDWHQSAEMDGIQLTALPAVHFSGRGMGDRNETLWCSWAIQSAAGNIFFAGDTGYSPTLFKGIGQQFRGFDIAIVPIGAYDPANVMQPVHTNPEEAIQMANDVKADLIIPSHWGTIILTDEPPFEPLERYRAYANKNGISDRRAGIMKIGETRII
ncbi:MAG: MBL fold metallo-hydrolase [Thermodesulfobacteriota bacterium]